MNWYPAPGKLNLFLHILGRRTDGYHELQTVFRLIDRSDRIGIAPRSDGRLRFEGPFGEENLCVLAARLLQRETKTGQGADLRLEKQLPIGGGLGGGSSDAATVLLVLNKVWDLGLTRDALQDLSLELGADVPFFVFGHNAVGEGIGERLRALELPAAWYLVLTPQVTVSTKEMFDSALTADTKRLKIPPFFSGQGRNDLEPVVRVRYPEVAAQLAWLKSRCAQARMTGSGACVFAEFETKAQADAVQSQLPPGMSGFVAQGLERHPLHDRAD